MYISIKSIKFYSKILNKNQRVPKIMNNINQFKRKEVAILTAHSTCRKSNKERGIFMAEINKAMLPTNDYIFKRIFGYKGKEKITKGFIEAITNHKIDSIELGESTILEKDLNDDKIGILDVKAVLNNNMQCNIEMQVVNKSDIEKRLLYYWSRLYGKSIKEGEDYWKLKNTIEILVADFELEKLKEIPKFHTEFKIREKEFHSTVLTDALEIHIIELPKILKKIEDGEVDKKDRLTLWTIFLINPDKIGGKEMSDNEEIKEAKELYDKIQSSEREQELAELRLKYIRDNNAIQKYGYEHGYERGREDGKIVGMEEGKKEGIKKGKEEGKKAGREEGRKEGIDSERKRMAKKLLELGMEIEEVQKITELSVQEIKNIKK